MIAKLHVHGDADNEFRFFVLIRLDNLVNTSHVSYRVQWEVSPRGYCASLDIWVCHGDFFYSAHTHHIFPTSVLRGRGCFGATLGRVEATA